MTETIKIKVYNLKGESVGETKIPAIIFGVEPKTALVHQVVVAESANYRQVIAHTKDRSEVRGGGKKPWRQKGTGRARHGSIRSPLWKGGGVTFGPSKNRNFSKNINKKMSRQALTMVLSDKVKENKFIVVEDLKLKELKTKILVAVLNKLPAKNRRSLLMLGSKEKEVKTVASNINTIITYKADSINTSAAIGSQYIIVSKIGLKEFIDNYSKTK